jgi:hypothetical protein
MKGTVGIEWNVGGFGAELLAVGMVIPVIMSVLAPFPSDLASDSGWGPRILITDDNANQTIGSGYPAVEFDIFGNLYVVWRDSNGLDGSGPDPDIYLRKWNATTGTWGPRVLVTDDNENDTEPSNLPQIVSDSFGNIHIAWHDDSDLTGTGYGGAYWRMWDAGTEEWLPTEHVSYEPNDTFTTGAYPALAADRFGNVHLSFAKGNPGPAFGIQYMKWNGTTHAWGAKSTVSGNMTESDTTWIAVDPSGDVHVTWSDRANISGASSYGKDYDIFYRGLDSTTGSWGPIVHVNDDDLIDEAGSGVTDIVADVFGNVYVVWQESADQAGMGYGLDPDIFFRKWNATSGVWEPRVIVSSDSADTAGSMTPRIDADINGNVHVVWRDHSDVDGAGLVEGDIFYRKWNATSDSWEDTISLTNDLNDQYLAQNPDIASDKHGSLAVVWWDYGDLLGSGRDSDIYARRYEIPSENLQATVDCDPDTLNLKSQGMWMTCYIELPSGYDPRDIDASTILLNDVLAPELDPKYGFVKSEDSYITDNDGDGVLERMVKFDRSEVQKMLSPGDSVSLTITGKMFDGTEFDGTDVIRVIDPVQSTHPTGPMPPRQVRSESPVEFLDRMRTRRTMANLI